MSDLPIISKELFVETIQAIQQQMAHDKRSSELMSEAFKIDEFALYDNSLLIKQIINLLSIWFDKSDLEHYIFDLNFGKPSSESECETVESFYHRLILPICEHNYITSADWKSQTCTKCHNRINL